MAETMFTWFLIGMMVLLAIASVKIIITSSIQIYEKFQVIFGEKQVPSTKSIQV